MHSEDSYADKSEVRRIVRRRLEMLSCETKAAASRAVFGRMLSEPLLLAARTVALYCSLDDEPATHGIIGHLSQSKRIVVPRVEGDGMQFYDWSAGMMNRGAFGIDEPCRTPLCRPEDIDLIIMPGRAFTPDGVRLGRGRG